MRELKIFEAKGLGMASKTSPNLQRYFLCWLVVVILFVY